MSEHIFGLGPGHLPRRADRIARRHGARLTNHTDPGCSCGYGCFPSEDCPSNARHWFTSQNLGEPFDSATGRAVMADLMDAGLVREG